MLKRRPRGVWEIGLATFEAAWSGRSEHMPFWEEYPDALVERIQFRAGGGLDWRLSALRTPRPRPAAWKIVVVTGAPSWAEYWSAALATIGPDREMVVVDRPGFGSSEPMDAVTDLVVQAKALSPLLDAAPGQKVLLVGQSYGAAVATLMAAADPGRVHALVLLSGLFGDMGPTATSLVELGRRIHGVIPRDLRNAITEVLAQKPQLPVVCEALRGLAMPIHIIHGDADDFAPIAAALAVAEDLADKPNVFFTPVPHANHFLNERPVELVLEPLEAVIAAATPDGRARAPSFADWLLKLGESLRAGLAGLAPHAPAEQAKSPSGLDGQGSAVGS
ncbi:MAG TPA: alpha/beta hydrolase [Caulobacteraceae bacterium]|nr:alpha/beta hydrolase [Caulobacteraceae bacterium]